MKKILFILALVFSIFSCNTVIRDFELIKASTSTGTILAPADTIVVPLPINTIPPLRIVTTNLLEQIPFSIIFDGEENETTKDLKNVLSGYQDGRIINIKKVPIENRTGQAFYISANGTTVELHYTCEQSLENAVYTYLSDLGINWYGPGDNWLYKPGTLKSVINSGEWKEPTFRNRIFAGTGGLATPMPVIDPNFTYRDNWYTWKRRNRFSEDFGDVGHTGGAFYRENQAILDANPHWFNSYTGKIYGRLKIENDSAMNVYKAWTLSKYNSNNVFNNIGVDPEDGRGGSDDPLPPNGFKEIENWNYGDKWWWLANEVSKQFDENNPNIQVEAYAYGDGPYNVLVPKFKLRKNVYPVIIPYAFQTAYLPNQMIRTWAKALDGNMGIYDYWNITQWSLGLPQFNIYDMPSKLKFWADNKITGINIETTDAAGPMGHAWWLGSQLEFDISKNIDVLFTKYLQNCFGAGWKSMKKMYDRWSLNYQGNAEVNFSLHDLKEAGDLVELNGSEWKRLNDVKAYVHFLKMMAQRTNTQSNNDSLYQYIYSINNRMLVQTPAFIGQSYFGLPPTPLSSHQLTDAEVEADFDEDLVKLSPQYNISNLVFDFDKVSYIEPVENSAWKFGGHHCEFFFKAPFTGEFLFDAGAEYIAPLRISTDETVLIDEEVGTSNFDFTEDLIGRTWSMKHFNIQIEKDRMYYIKMTYGFNRLKINTPGIVLFNNQGTVDFDNAQYPWKYFYVPKDATEVVFTDDLNGTNDERGAGVYTLNDIKLPKMSAGAVNTFKVLVPIELRGTVLKATFGYPLWSLKNIPNVVSLQKFGYAE